MSTSRFVLVLVLIFLIETHSQMVNGYTASSLKFRKTMLEKLNESKSQATGYEAPSLVERLDSFLRSINKKIESYDKIKVKSYRPLMQGRFG